MWTITTFQCTDCFLPNSLFYLQVDTVDPHFYRFQCQNVGCNTNSKKAFIFICRICNTYKRTATTRKAVNQHCRSKKHQDAVSNIMNSITAPNNDDDVGSGDIFVLESNHSDSPGAPFNSNDYHSSHNDNDCNNSSNIDDQLDVDRNNQCLPTDPYTICSNMDYISALHDKPPPLPIAIAPLFNEEEMDYFDACVNHVGHKFVTNQAMTLLTNAYEKDEKPVTSLYTLLLAKLSLEITGKQREILSTLLSHVYHSGSDNNLQIFVPSCGNDIRNKIVDGRHSVKENLPIPKIVHFDDGFIYVCLKSTIKHLFCSERPPNPFIPFSHSVHANTRRGKELLNPEEVAGSFTNSNGVYDNGGYPIYPIKLMPWADDFEAFSVVKNNGQSVHVAFVTIGAIDGDHSGRYTFLLWMGNQKLSPTQVEQHFADQINSMNNSPFLVFSREHNCIVDVKPKLYAFLCDRPDKSKRLQLLNGGNTHACWSYSGEYYNAIDRSVLCQYCFSQLMKNEAIGSDASTPCNICYSLDFDLMKYLPHPDYPKEMITPEERPVGEVATAVSHPLLLPFKKITIEGLKAACRVGFAQIKNKLWSQKQLLRYLRCEGINEDYSMLIYANGSNAALISLDFPTPAAVAELLLANPASFELPPFPPLWGIEQNFTPDIFIDCPMHLLFLGTYKSLNKHHLPKFLTTISKKSTGIQFINVKLHYVMQELPKYLDQSKVHYLPLHPTCGGSDMNYGKWLSKNWISHQRVSKWIHADLQSYGRHSTISSTISGKSFLTYSLSEIRRWCSTRAIPFPVELKKVAQARTWFVNALSSYDKLFQHYTEDDILKYISQLDNLNDLEGKTYSEVQLMTSTDLKIWFGTFVQIRKEFPPEIQPKFDVDSVRGDIQDLISLHHCIVSRVMHGCTGLSVGRHVKMYLTIFHRVDKAMGGSKTKAAVVHQMNLITMLNLEPTINRFGPLRYLWEGGGMGEGSIPKVKQFIYDMKPNFARNAAASNLQKLSIENLLFSAYKEVQKEMLSNKQQELDQHSLRLLQAVSKTVEKEANRNGCSDSFIGSTKHDEPFSGLDQGGEIASIYLTHEHTPQSCPVARGDLVVPVVIDVQDNTIFIVVKGGMLVQVSLCLQDPKNILDGTFLHAQMLTTGNIAWSTKQRRNLVCGLMLRHPDFSQHYYTVAMNWMEAAVSQLGLLSFILPRFRGATYEDGEDEKSAEYFLKNNKATNNNSNEPMRDV